MTLAPCPLYIDNLFPEKLAAISFDIVKVPAPLRHVAGNGCKSSALLRIGQSLTHKPYRKAE
jgi:hypothetical protein